MTEARGTDDPTDDEGLRLLEERDPRAVARVMPLLRLATKWWFRSEVRDVDRIPEGGVLLVSNHSGGIVAMDVPVIAVAVHDRFGAERPIYVLAHDVLFTGNGADLFGRYGFVPASRGNAAAALRAGGLTIVFPGGDHDVFRPWHERNTIVFDGRTGYVRTALEAGVPIVPVVSIGGQEAQIHLSRGEVFARLLRLEKLLRMKYLPLQVGFPFGLTFPFPPNLPLPTKITTQVLDPIDPVAMFGPDPDVAEVDAVVRHRMQTALDELARQRRFPVIG